MDQFKPQIKKESWPHIKEWQSIRWLCPSNIALIKYWGKHGEQMPDNPSLSFSLSKSITRLNFQYRSRKGQSRPLEFLFENKPHAEFKKRVVRVVESLKEYFPFLDHYQIRLNTVNTFPHSSGIASSASGMGALTLALCEMEQQLLGTLPSEEDFFRKASFCARIASGSASRSVYGGFVSWGKTKLIHNSSDFYAQPLPITIHSKFQKLCDAVLIVSSEKKRISSTAGHHLMQDHVYHDARIHQAQENVLKLLESMEIGDFNTFLSIVEHEALSLHALMMASKPGYLLMEPGTLQLIEKIRNIRDQKRMEICFTLDAGPNIHLIYPDEMRQPVLELIKSDLTAFCENQRWIDDRIGDGPVHLQS